MLNGGLLCAHCKGLLTLPGCMVVVELWCDGIRSNCVPWCEIVVGLDSKYCSFCLCFVGQCRIEWCWFARCDILGMCGGIFPGEVIVSEWVM